MFVRRCLLWLGFVNRRNVGAGVGEELYGRQNNGFGRVGGMY